MRTTLYSVELADEEQNHITLAAELGEADLLIVGRHQLEVGCDRTDLGFYAIQ